MKHLCKEANITYWLEAWDAHDLERIMNHYADEVEFLELSA
jgi:ketosteroid isomerase-like protein